jgi:hypothetical protein
VIFVFRPYPVTGVVADQSAWSIEDPRIDLGRASQPPEIIHLKSRGLSTRCRDGFQIAEACVGVIGRHVRRAATLLGHRVDRLLDVPIGRVVLKSDGAILHIGHGL